MNQENIQAVYRLSPMQEGILFQHLCTPGSGLYFEQSSCVLSGDVDIQALEKSWQHVLERHPILRTAFVWKNVKNPLQVVHRNLPITIHQQDWRDVGEEEQERRWSRLLEQDQQNGFVLSRGPLMRLHLAQVGPESYRFCWSFSHLLLDGWSVPLVIREVFTCYQGYCRGEKVRLPEPRPYSEYIAWLQRQSVESAEQYWRKYLEGVQRATTLQIEQAGGWHNQGPQEEEQIRLSVETTVGLQSLARQHGLTLNTVVQAAWTLVMSGYSGERDVVFGATLSGRPAELEGVEGMVGLFINTLPVRARVEPDEPALEWMRRLQQQQLESQQYQHTPLAEVRKWSSIAPPAPLFRYLFVFQNYKGDRGITENPSGLTLGSFHSVERSDHSLCLAAGADPCLWAQATYYEHRFSRSSVQQLLGSLQVVLQEIAAYPEKAIGDLLMLDHQERRRLIQAGTGPQAHCGPHDSVAQLWEQQTARTPDSIALIFDDQCLTFAQLDRLASAHAQRLLAAGVGPESLVGLYAGRSVAMAVGMLAIWKAGAVLLPLDPALPPERIAFLLEDAAPAVIFTVEAWQPALPWSAAQVLLLDPEQEMACPAIPIPTSIRSPQQAAYVLYTSGSTGRPKGVVIEQAGLLSYLEAMQQVLQLGEGDRVLQFASPGFDVTEEEMLPAWVSGGAVVMSSQWLPGDCGALQEVLSRHQVSTLELPAGYWRQWVREMQREGTQPPASLRVLMLGSERVALEELRAWSEYGVPIVQVFGLTETTITSTVHRQEAWAKAEELPLGQPITGTQIYVLDGEMNLAPAGVAGELYIGGGGVGRGYWNRPELTAERFLPDPFGGHPGARLYRSGDLARYRSDGQWEFLGRQDHQVKIRGYRVELGEVEAALEQHPGVHQAVVVVREESGEHKRLVGYVACGDAAPPVSELRSFLEPKLPEYMIPSLLMMLPALPMTPNGKVDRKALPELEAVRAELQESYEAPQGTVEEALAGIWKEVLGVERVGRHDNFFQLGGDSILSIQIVARAHQAGLQLTPRQLFEHPTVAALGGVAREREGQAGSGEEEKRRDVEELYALSPMQEGMLFHSLYAPQSGVYLAQLNCILQGPLDDQKFQQAWRQAVERHAALRTCFVWGESGKPLQKVQREVELQWRREDWRERSEAEQETGWQAWLREDREAGFDFQQAPLMRHRLVRVGEDRYRFVWSFPNLLLDGWSLPIVIGEVLRNYEGGCRGEVVKWQPVRSYGDYIEWLERQDRGAAERYWRQSLEGVTGARVVRVGGGGGEGIEGHGEEQLQMSEESTRQLQEMGRRAGLTLNTLVQGAWGLVLSRYSGAGDVVFGATVSGRPSELAGVEQMVGLFINTLPVRVKVEGEERVVEWLQRLQAEQAQARQYDYTPLASIQRWSGLGAATPLFETLLVFRNFPADKSMVPSDTSLRIEYARALENSHYPLTLVSGDDSRFTLAISYDRSRFASSAVAALLAALESVLSTFLEPHARVADCCAKAQDTTFYSTLPSALELKRARSEKLHILRRKATAISR